MTFVPDEASISKWVVVQPVWLLLLLQLWRGRSESLHSCHTQAPGPPPHCQIQFSIWSIPSLLGWMGHAMMPRPQLWCVEIPNLSPTRYLVVRMLVWSLWFPRWIHRQKQAVHRSDSTGSIHTTEQDDWCWNLRTSWYCILDLERQTLCLLGTVEISHHSLTLLPLLSWCRTWFDESHSIDPVERVDTWYRWDHTLECWKHLVGWIQLHLRFRQRGL